MRYNRIEGRFCWVIPRVKDFGISFCFRRPAFERPVVPFAPLPLRGGIPLLVRWYPRRLGGGFREGGGCCPALPPYRWGVSLARKALFLLWESGVFLLCSCFLPAQQGPKPLFLLSAKEKAVLDSEKEKVDQWKSWGGAVQQDRNPMLLWYPSGKRL